MYRCSNTHAHARMSMHTTTCIHAHMHTHILTQNSIAEMDNVETSDLYDTWEWL